MDTDNNTTMEVIGHEESVALGGSHDNEDLPSHGTWVMSVPDPTTLPEKGWEEGRVADMPSAGGPKLQTLNTDSVEGGKGARRKSQQFTDLCRKFEEAEETSQAEKARSIVPVKNMICSEDTLSASKVSSIISSKEPPHLSTFTSLRENWERQSNFSARKPVFRQKLLSFSRSGLSLVSNSANKKRGGDTDKGSAGKRYRGT